MKNILLQLDSAVPHTSRTTMEAIEKMDRSLTAPSLQSRLAATRLPSFARKRRSTSVDTCKTRRSGKVRQDVDEESQGKVLSWRLLETRPSLSEVFGERANGGDNVEK
jgi:hypothetical protein